MSIPPLLSHFDKTARWMRRGGQESDIAISSRVRLARNFCAYLFPHSAEMSDLLQIRTLVLEALSHLATEEGSPLQEFLQQLGVLSLEEFAGWERKSLIAQHLTSKEHIRRGAGRTLAASADASLSLLVNEEDHLRLQILLPGLQLHTAYQFADQFDSALEEYFEQRDHEFAFSDSLGYLTACPSNIGTGMRASVMLHLPALEIAGRLEEAHELAKKKEFALRGTFGEDSPISGHLHQLSNQLTLGQSENEILMEVEEAARQICELERAARSAIPTDFLDDARDAIGRAYGTLRYARRVGSREAADLLSMLRLAHELGWAKGISRQRFNELQVWARPAYLQLQQGRSLESNEHKTLRAALLREQLKRVRLDPILTREEKEQPTAEEQVALA